ncbi:hypothetical protein PSI9734_00820 [Pseudidiomarina piscicola]|uniref:Endonuclease/exonuclease/phosphatase domain-containing protein n=1 Tax=Pseudidiomarina piscicola TaxID=2614830 RepID=A0A6S6WQY1_9GAMM|nr:ExeM/NucH family extracellular endonuclease [Pseudidiomarina piscicola]CAB0150266.1 hypothetical protein PSI9734_00820 [Pseudidiomarina piscicola]VZT39694.1 hypothetical protein PSI9734_00820 [Pseudomonas aeruginosa]
MNNNNSAKMINGYRLLLAAAAVISLTACSSSTNEANTALAQCETQLSLPAIQGSTAQSPYLDQHVTVSGIVTASWQQSQELGGFFMQQTTAEQTAGIFVRTSEREVKAGDLIKVSGVVREHQQLTQLDTVEQVLICGHTELPKPKELRLPVATQAVLEQLEGQYVNLPQQLVVNGTYLLGRHGSFDVASERLYTPTQVAAPGAAARAHAKNNALKRLVIDDNQAPSPAVVPYPSPELTAATPLRSGDHVTNVSGILSEYNGSYRIQPTSELVFHARHPRPKPPAKSDDPRVLRVATFNVLNYFNGEGATHQFPTDRGAETAADFARQEAKIIAALAALDADVVGLMELENDGYNEHSAIVRLTEQLAQATNQPWQFVRAAENQFGDASITNGLIYRADRVTTIGQPLTITTGPFSNRSRYPLIQRLRPQGSQEAFVIAINHFKSKGSCPRDANDPNANQNDGQGCWNQVRSESAQLLVDIMQDQPVLAQTPAQIVLGDFNAYAQEDPIKVMTDAGFHNRSQHFEPNGYSYVYDAQAGSLDHVLVSAALHGRVLNQQHWYINADEPPALSYEGYQDNPKWYAPTPYRSSDHDPIITDIQF